MPWAPIRLGATVSSQNHAAGQACDVVAWSVPKANQNMHPKPLPGGGGVLLTNFRPAEYSIAVLHTGHIRDPVVIVVDTDIVHRLEQALGVVDPLPVDILIAPARPRGATMSPCAAGLLLGYSCATSWPTPFLEHAARDAQYQGAQVPGAPPPNKHSHQSQQAGIMCNLCRASVAQLCCQES